jgi:hypothetical protein
VGTMSTANVRTLSSSPMSSSPMSSSAMTTTPGVAAASEGVRYRQTAKCKDGC